MQAESLLIVISLSMTIAIALFACAILLTRKGERRDHECFLAAFLGFYALIKLDQLYLNTAGYEYFPHLAGLMFSAKLFLPPLIFFYARAVTSPTPYWLTKRDSYALLAPVLATLIAVPYYLLTAEQKIALMNPLTRDPVLYERAILGCQIGLTMFVTVAFIYLGSSLKLISTHLHRIKDLFSQIEDKSLNWLRSLLAMIVFGWVLYAISEYLAVTSGRPEGMHLGLLMFELIWLSTIASGGIKQNAIYQTLVSNGSVPENEEQEQGNVSGINLTTVQPYSRSGIDELDRIKISEQLSQAMESEKLFLNPELSLRDLSQYLGVADNSLSQTFSQLLHTSFFDYINGLRVQFACELLQNSSLNVLSVALESGFNSRSTFNTAFKKHTGDTPSQFRKKHQPLDSIISQ